MVYYEIAILFAVLTIGLANPMQSHISNGASRCCLPEQFTSTLTTSVAFHLYDIHMISYVSLFVSIRRS